MKDIINVYKKDIEYNKMIKTQIDESIFENTINDEFEMMDVSNNKRIVTNYRKLQLMKRLMYRK